MVGCLFSVVGVVRFVYIYFVSRLVLVCFSGSGYAFWSWKGGGGIVRGVVGYIDDCFWMDSFRFVVRIFCFD